jgi:DNA invertase Pin-like site-specific DNA recombinase
MGQTLIYARVSTAEQNLAQQRSELWDHATEELGVDPANLDVLSDTSTGTDIDRAGYRELRDRIHNEDVDRVIAREVTRLGRNMREISELVHEMVDDHDVGLAVVNDNLHVEAGEELSLQDKMILEVLAWSAELEAEKIRENTLQGLRAAEKAGKWIGRPPFGFTTDDDGYLQPTDEFGDAVRAIRGVQDHDWSHRKAARHTGVPRRTVPNLLENADLYLEKTEQPE